jgi:hypothetical protein
MGSRKKDTVDESSAVCLEARLYVELRAGSGPHQGDRSLLKGRCGSALARRRLDYVFFGDYFYEAVISVEGRRRKLFISAIAV